MLGPARGGARGWFPAWPGDAGRELGHGPFGRARLFELFLVCWGARPRRPVLLVIEDCTGRMARRATYCGSSCAARARGGCAGADLPLRRPASRASARPYLAELGRDPRVGRIVLRPFSRDELADHVVALTGRAAAPRTSTAVRALGGERVLHRGVAGRGSGPRKAAGSASLRDAMLARSSACRTGRRRSCGWSRQRGRRVDHRLLAAAAPASEDELAAALREAGPPRCSFRERRASYSFRHALLREAAYAELLPGEREALHAGWRANSRRGPSWPAPRTLTPELAHHWHAAGSAGAGASSASVRAGQDGRACLCPSGGAAPLPARARARRSALPPYIDRLRSTGRRTDRAARAARAWALRPGDGARPAGDRAGRRAREPAARRAAARPAGGDLEDAGRGGRGAGCRRAAGADGRRAHAGAGPVLEAHARLLLPRRSHGGGAGADRGGDRHRPRARAARTSWPRR